MDECLAYFRSAIANPGSAPPWTEWWRANEDLVRRSFDRADYLSLKFCRLDAAEEPQASKSRWELFKLHELREQGVTEIFYSDVHGAIAAPFD